MLYAKNAKKKLKLKKQKFFATLSLLAFQLGRRAHWPALATPMRQEVRGKFCGHGAHKMYNLVRFFVVSAIYVHVYYARGGKIVNSPHKQMSLKCL